eukprot:GEMP01042931.1.p1 GENE.GEMP01042931.1~~GEMP01042931.1.p1  ORF type:complete len:564 (+),score=100.35 GEMP01042931.1:114-1805(+)
MYYEEEIETERKFSVQYVTTTEIVQNLEHLFFCDGCTKIKGRTELTDELDSWYCPRCLENMPSAESMLFGVRCSKCYECPLCFQDLILQQRTDGEKDAPVFVFSCHNCRWRSDASGLTAESADKLQQKLHDIENKNRLKEVNSKMVDMYRNAATESRKRKEYVLKMKRRSMSVVNLAYGSARRSMLYRGGKVETFALDIFDSEEVGEKKTRDSFHFKELEELLDKKEKAATNLNLRDTETLLAKTRTPKEIIDYYDPDSPPQDGWKFCERGSPFYNEDVDADEIVHIRDGKLQENDVTQVTTSNALEIKKSLILVEAMLTSADQRTRQAAYGLGALGEDPTTRNMLISGVLPVRKPLHTKRSRRCNECHRIVIKPQINPSSFPPFQKENVAIKFIPRCQPCFFNWIWDGDAPLDTLVFTGRAELFLFMVNPQDIPCIVRFRPGTFGNIAVTTPDFSISFPAFNDLVDIGHEVPVDPAIAATDDPKIVKDRFGNKVLFVISIATPDAVAAQDKDIRKSRGSSRQMEAEPPFTCSVECDLLFERPQPSGPPVPSRVQFGLRFTIG